MEERKVLQRHRESVGMEIEQEEGKGRHNGGRRKEEEKKLENAEMNAGLCK